MAMTKARIEKFFSILRAENPHPKSDLEYTNPFTLLVAVVLSAQTTDKGVNLATRELFKVADTPEKMAQLGVNGIKDYIRTIGLFNAKANNVHRLSEMLMDRFEGQVPHTRDDLMTLPGVGRKTANVVLNVAFGVPTMAVDTHVFRVANRTGLAAGDTPEQVEEQLLKRVPSEFMDHAHHWLILHGRYVCRARAPKCETCLVQSLCAFPDKEKSKK